MTIPIRPSRREEDPRRSRAQVRSIILAVGSFVGVFVVFIVLALTGVAQTGPIHDAIGWGSMFVVGGTLLYMAWTFASSVYFHRCSECGGATVKVPEALPAIHRY